MFTENQSKLYFLLGCIPARIAIALLPLYLDKDWLPYYGGGLLAIATGFSYLYFTNKRLNAVEAGGNTWWSNYRLFHAAMYLCAGIYAIMKSRIASLPLFTDVFLGLGLFLDQHYL
jgi:hypothetical protein